MGIFSFILTITIHHFRKYFKILTDRIANSAGYDQLAHMCWQILVCTGTIREILLLPAGRKEIRHRSICVVITEIIEADWRYLSSYV
jgi:hypothetical protein